MDIIRQPNEDAWSFVWHNFYGLAMFWAGKHVRALRRPDDFEDIKNDMLYGMVEVYNRYRDRPLVDTIKIIKSVPFHYYTSKLLRKNNLNKERLDDHAHHLTVDSGSFDNLYDYYYDRFLTDHYLGDDCVDEREVLMQIVMPSDDFKAYIKDNGCSLGRDSLYGFFRSKYKWSRRYFDQVFKNARVAA